MRCGALVLALCMALVRQLPAQAASSSSHQAHLIRFHNYTDKQILDYLLDPVRYDHRIRPEERTQVNVSVLLLTLSSPDESSLKYEIEFLLHQKWEDHRLRFVDDVSFPMGHLNGLLHESRVWKPDIYFLKHGEFKSPLTPIHMSLRLFPNGTVLYTLRRHMTLVCQGNLKIFPFDNPKCPFAVESMSYEESQLKIDWSPTEPSINTATSLRAHNAYLAKNETGYCDTRHTWRGNYSCLRVLLVFTRDKSFYISTVFVPGIVLVTSSFISFWLDINAVPARVMIGVTTMLNFCTTTNSFRSTLPVVSNLTAMNLWDGVCMFFIYASMLEFIIVNYLYRNLGMRQHHHHGAGGRGAQSRPSSSTGGAAAAAEPSVRAPLLQATRHRAQEFEMTKKPHDCNTLMVSSRSDISGSILEDVIGGSVAEQQQGSNHKAISGGQVEQHPQHPHQLTAAPHDVNSLVRPVSASAGLAGLGTTPGSVPTPTDAAGIDLSTGDPAAGSMGPNGVGRERLRAMASVFAWLRRPQLFPNELPPKPRIAKAIDYFSRTVFPVLFGVFTFGFFLAYAVIGPSAAENWKLIEY